MKEKAKKQLIIAIQGGDYQAFDELMDLELNYVFSICLARINNIPDAIRATKEVFIEAFKQLHTIEDYDLFEAWLGKQTIKYCDNWLAGNIAPSEFIINSSLASYHEPVGHVGQIYHAIRTLNIEIRQILLMYYFNNNDSFCVAKLVGHEPGTLRIILASARFELHELISDEKNYCKDQADKISQFAVGSLAINDSIELQKHLAQCDNCKQYLHQLKNDERPIDDFIKGLNETLCNIPKDVIATIESQGFENFLKKDNDKLKAIKSKLIKMRSLLFFIALAIVVIFVLKKIANRADIVQKDSSVSVKELIDRENKILGVASKKARLKRQSLEILALSKTDDIPGLIAILKDDRYDMPVKIFVANVLSNLSATDAIDALEKLNLKMDRAVNPFSIAIEKIRPIEQDTIAPIAVILAGYVVDANDEPLQNVLITVDSNDSLAGKTDEDGYYEISGNIETGEYSVEISCANCPDQNVVSLQLVADEITERDFTIALEIVEDVNIPSSLPTEDAVDSNDKIIDSNIPFQPAGEFSLVGTLIFDMPENVGEIEISAISSSEKVFSIIVPPDSNSFEITSVPDKTYTILLRGENIESAVIEDVNVHQEIEVSLTVKQQ